MSGTNYETESKSSSDQSLRQAAQLLNAHAPAGERLAFLNADEERILREAGGSGQPSAGGVPSYKGGVAAPPARDLYKETRDTLQAQIDLAPKLASSEAQYRPLYNALDLQDLNYMLLGGRSLEGFDATQPISTRTITETKNLGETPQSKAVNSPFKFNRQYQNYGQMQPVTNSVTTETVEKNFLPASYGKSKGLLDLYEQDITPTMTRIENADRASRIAGEMDAINKYGKSVTETLRDASGNRELLAMMNDQARSELAAGASLDPSLRREIQQGIRSAQASRGMGYGMRDLADESIMTAMQAEQLRRNRQNFATQVIGLNQATGGDPFMAILGRPSQAFQATQNVGGQAYGMSQGIGNKIFNPTDQYAADLYNQNYQGQLAARTASAANSSALTGALIGGGAAIGGAAIIAA